MSNDAGAVSEGPYTYDAYGQCAGSAGVPFKYAGRRLDPETGLYYYRARYYSAALGRFLQTDPIGYADQMNLYGYVANDPVNATDPSGEIGISDFEDPDETTESELRSTQRTAPPPGRPSRTAPGTPPVRIPPGTKPRPPGWGAPNSPPPPARTSPYPGPPDIVPSGSPEWIDPTAHRGGRGGRGERNWEARPPTDKHDNPGKGFRRHPQDGKKNSFAKAAGTGAANARSHSQR